MRVRVHTNFRDHELEAAMGRTTFQDGRGTLAVDGRAVCEVEIAASGPARRRGLLGRDSLAGHDGQTAAILLTPAASVHTLGMRFPIDVAFLDRQLVVREVVTMPPGRLGRLRLRARHILETQAGACARLGISPGTRIHITTDQPAGPP
jgi:uncharacterized membrane protein (UPF0127 family)